MSFTGVKIKSGASAGIDVKKEKKEKLHLKHARIYEQQAPYNYSYYGYTEGSNRASLIDKSTCMRIAKLAGFQSCSPEGYSIISGLFDLGVADVVEEIRQIGLVANSNGYRGLRFGHPHHVDAYVTKYTGDIAQGRIPTAGLSRMAASRNALRERQSQFSVTSSGKIAHYKKLAYSATMSIVKWGIKQINTGFSRTSKNKLTVFIDNKYTNFVTAYPKVFESFCWPASKDAQDAITYGMMAANNTKNGNALYNREKFSQAIFGIIGECMNKTITKKTAPILWAIKPWDILFAFVSLVGSNQADSYDVHMGYWYDKMSKTDKQVFWYENIEDSPVYERAKRSYPFVLGLNSYEDITPSIDMTLFKKNWSRILVLFGVSKKQKEAPKSKAKPAPKPTPKTEPKAEPMNM